ncbi:hypothetical protein QR680_006208 [Steinernema hermaphroditum]|uniref:Uncharacterized protein n=1 Tax=Steinernema hermaphroditum TaxID=289476 RepID=A0AA39HUN8_9BILA|nr:hypothetical protein QR680_006208 [Steinernema hermaphroditum]
MRVVVLLLGCFVPFLMIGLLVAIGMFVKPDVVRISPSPGDPCDGHNCGPALKCVLIAHAENGSVVSRRCVLFR